MMVLEHFDLAGIAMNKLVSVIIPAFNEELMIKNTLISLREQNYQPLEVIVVVDSHSKDNTFQVAKRHADKVLHISKPGASAARNFGANVAQGEYLMFLDADTKVSDNLISNGVEFLNKGYAAGFARVIYETESAKVKSIETIQNLYLSQRKPFYVQCFYTSKEIFQKAGGWDEKIRLGEEVDLLRRISKLGELKYDPDSSVRTSPRRFVKNKDLFYAVFGASLALTGIKNLPYPPVREIKQNQVGSGFLDKLTGGKMFKRNDKVRSLL